MIEEDREETTFYLYNSQTKLFKLNSAGNWNDEGTGKTSIVRSMQPVQSLEITFKMNLRAQDIQNSDSKSQQEQQRQQQFMFESIGSYSIQSNSILVFTSRQKRFALSFKDSDIKFLEFFSDKIKVSAEQQVLDLNPSSIMEYITKDSTFLTSLKTTFRKSQSQQDIPSVMNLVDIFKKLLCDCNQSFIKLMFATQHIEFLFSVMEYANPNPRQTAYREYIKQLKYENILNLPPNIEKAAKLIIYLTQFKDIAPLLVQPIVENCFTYITYESSTAIVNYILSHSDTLITIIQSMEENIKKGAKLLTELLTLCAAVSVQNKNKLLNLLIKPEKGNIFYKLTQCLYDKDVRTAIEQRSKQDIQSQHIQTTYQTIIKILSTISSSNPSQLQTFFIQTIKNKALPQHNLCSAIVFGYIHGKISLRSVILQLLTNIFNPQSSYKHYTVTDEQGNIQQSKQIYLLLDRHILTPICKKLFSVSTNFEGEELILQWISKMFCFFPTVMRRIVVQSGILKKALDKMRKQRILLLLILKIFKSMLQIKDMYTIRYLKFSRIIDKLNEAYQNNNNKPNLIGSLFKSIRSDIQQLNYEGKNLKELEKVFHVEQ